MFRVLISLKRIATGLFLFWGLLAAAVNAQVQTINPGGGTSLDYSNGVEITVGNQADFQMVANNVGHLYPSGGKPPNMGYSSVALRLDGPSGTRIYGRGVGANGTFVSQSAVTGAGTTGSPWQLVTVFSPTGTVPDTNIQITVTDSYVLPNLYFTRQIAVTGLSASDTVKLYWFFDSMVGGNDYGIGYLSGTIVGTRHPTTQEKLEFHPNGASPVWNRYFSGQYNVPASQIQSGSGDLSNTITTNPVDAGMALQWNVPAASTSFTTAVDLVYVPAGIFAREAFVPSSVITNGNSRMTITLSTVNTSASLATFGYTLSSSGVTVAATPNLTNSCTPGGGTVTVTPLSNSISVNNLQLSSMPVGGPAYTCEIAFDVTGTTIGFYQASFASSDGSVGHSATTYGTLEVTPVVLLETAFSPAVITEGGVSRFIVTVLNRDPLTAQIAQDFTYDSFDPNLVAVSPLAFSSTCSGTPNVAVSGTTLTFSQINLPAATSSTVPSSCQISVSMTSPQQGYYSENYTGSTTGVAPSNSTPTAQLIVVKAVDVSPRFNPASVLAGSNTRLEISISNSSLLAFSGGNFDFMFSSTDIQPAATPNLTNTCVPGGTVTLSSAGVSVTNLALNAATSAPYRCTIAFDVETPGSVPYNSSYDVYFSTPDQSVSSLNNYAQLLVFSSAPAGGAVMSMILEKSTIAPNEPDTVTLNISSNELTPLTGLSFIYQFQTGVTAPGTFSSTCPGGAVIAVSSSDVEVGNLDLPAASGTPYRCTISFVVTSPLEGNYAIYLNQLDGAWASILNSNARFTVMSGFLPPPPNVAMPVPMLSPWALLLTLSGILWSVYFSHRNLFEKR